LTDRKSHQTTQLVIVARRAREQDIRVRFGKGLRELREARGLSQEALAFEAGLHRTYISSVERGERNVSLVNIERLAVALMAKPSELVV
jgi:transcriptional regulator with XRE-family HTH domain